MRSVIEEIATAEQQAEQIRQEAALQARELTQKAKEDAQNALSNLENESRTDMQASLDAAKKQGERLSLELLETLQQEADTLCNHANAKLDQAVSYLLDKVTRTA